LTPGTSGFQLLQPGLQILSAPEIEQAQGQFFQLRQAEGLDAGDGGGFNGSATAFQPPQGQIAGLAAAAFFEAQLPDLLPPQLDALLASFRKDVLNGGVWRQQGSGYDRRLKEAEANR
jgi:hypothetical protein